MGELCKHDFMRNTMKGNDVYFNGGISLSYRDNHAYNTRFFGA